MSRRSEDSQQAFEDFLFNPPLSVRLVRRSADLAAGAFWVTAGAVGTVVEIVRRPPVS